MMITTEEIKNAKPERRGGAFSATLSHASRLRLVAFGYCDACAHRQMASEKQGKLDGIIYRQWCGRGQRKTWRREILQQVRELRSTDHQCVRLSLSVWVRLKRGTLLNK